MKCYIRRYDNENKVWKDSWFRKHIGIPMCPNHWTIFKSEAKEFDSVKEARWYINFYKLKNCEVEK